MILGGVLLAHTALPSETVRKEERLVRPDRQKKKKKKKKERKVQPQEESSLLSMTDVVAHNTRKTHPWLSFLWRDEGRRKEKERKEKGKERR